MAARYEYAMGNISNFSVRRRDIFGLAATAAVAAESIAFSGPAVASANSHLSSAVATDVSSTYGLLQPSLAATRITPSQAGVSGRNVLTNNPGADGWTMGGGDASSNMNDSV